MRVAFEVTIQDRLDANWRVALQTPRSRWKLGAACVLGVLGVWLVVTQFLWLHPDVAASAAATNIAVWAGLVIGVAVSCLVYWVIQFDQRRSLRNLLHGEETFRVMVELSPRGVSLEDPTAQILYDWAKIKGVYTRGKSIDLVTFHGHTLWVPKRAFESPAAETQFIETVKGYLAEQGRTGGMAGTNTPAADGIRKG